MSESWRDWVSFGEPPAVEVGSTAPVPSDADREWLLAPADDARRPSIPRLAMLLWEERPDLAGSFPDPLGASRKDLALWYVTHGRREHGLHPSLVLPVLRTLSPLQRLRAELWSYRWQLRIWRHRRRRIWPRADHRSREWRRWLWMPLLSRFYPEVEVKVWNGQQMRIDLRDRVISRFLFEHGEYEADLQVLMSQLPLAGAVCLDIGANIGLHTVALSRLVGPEGRVFAFEPEARNFRLLQYNLRENGTRNVIARPWAVGAEEGVCRLALSGRNFGDHRVAVAPGYSARGPRSMPSLHRAGCSTGSDRGPRSMPSLHRVGCSTAGMGEEVRMTTIDAATGDLPPGAVHLIKIDVQGYEYHVLQGMRETLRRNPDTVLLLEVFPDALREAGSSPSALMEALRDMGMTGWDFDTHRVVPLSEPWVYDLIRDGTDVNVFLSRNGERLRAALSGFYGRPLPRVE